MNYESLKEKSSHGSALFPLHVYTHIDKYGNYSVNSHWHKEMEIVYIEEGEFELIVNMNSFKLSKGQCICINSGEIHSIDSIGDNTSIHHAIVFDPSILSSSQYDYCQINYIDPLLKGIIKFPTTIDEESKFGAQFINEVLDLINCYKSKKTGYHLSTKSYFFKILCLLVEENKLINNDGFISKSKDYKLELIKKVFKYINENYSNKIYIEDLASQVNMNTQYFCRFFKSVTGKTPVDYINHHRIENAAKMLVTSDNKIMDICFSVGFDNFSYFIKTFKQHKGCTPSQYRKSY